MRGPAAGGGRGRPGTATEPATTARAAARPGAQNAWLRRLAGYCARHRHLALMALGGSLVATLVQAGIPLIMAWIVDGAILEHRQPIWLVSENRKLSSITRPCGRARRGAKGATRSILPP
jgi:hypothetical protein